MMKFKFNVMMTYFVRGLLLTIPFALTIYIISIALTWIDGLLSVKIPGVGMAIILASITLLGYIGSSFFFKSIINYIERILKRLPIINLIYSSMKEFIATFVGDKKKFNKPVMVLVNKDANIRKMGFITQEDLSHSLNMPGYLTVYIPFSYAFSGELLIIEKERIVFLNISSTDAMRIIISGGVTGFNSFNNKNSTIDKDLII